MFLPAANTAARCSNWSDCVTTVRSPVAADRDQWHRLWAGYNAFYGANVPEAVTDSTWRRILESGSPIIGRIAEHEGRVAGFANLLVHASTWSTTPVCYLEDLFVAPSVRHAGVARALMHDAMEMAKLNGWSQVYWHTRMGNAPARALYDQFAKADDFVRYAIRLT
jgi:GNAT superfamily N-acetyltransferase